MLKAFTFIALSSTLFATVPAARAADETSKSGSASGGAIVMVVKATNACFSDMIRVTGFLVPRREAVVAVEQEGFRVNDVLVRDGDQVTENQELVRLGGPAAAAQAAQQQSRAGVVTLRAPAAGRIIQSTARAGAFVSPQLGPLFRIAIDDEIELDAEVPNVHVLKLTPSATARITIDGGPEVSGRVRVVAPEIDRRTQLGKVRLSVPRNPAIKVGMFARATIDANRSCGVSIPKSALDHLNVQVVKDNIVETRRVQIGLFSDTDIEIREGIKEGEIVVANAGTSLHDGDKVKTIFPDEFDRIRR
ncbi:efflux RND transporter periplasmic adaptor subunit [Bradyrhizobium sp. LHD-71]|uniref:efflux RND transporter periplasmic adaptor subunit n=1 Tax=Bradyrhizobium sp. LHD-71 TaxID=3072141 RepID=UPI00280E1610|nr:efflux RND transporter periplasmic adaptor subunit [Bradyrhizobium sp. LHD-71]MDQ8727123.1 efflux RND transporter periplasmic adaptor subunit [Bradyrhizobium sp. LHD-71]